MAVSGRHQGRLRRATSLLCMMTAVAGVLFCRSSVLGFTESLSLTEELQKVGKVWQQPHQLRIVGSKLELDSVSQGAEQWQVRVTEAGKAAGRPAAFAAREEGGSVTYGVNFDTANSVHKPAAIVKRAQFSLAGDEDSSDWTLSIQGDHGRHFSATGNSDEIVYDGAIGAEVPMRHGITALYALDLKKRSGHEGILPGWYQSSAGLRHSSKVGDFKVSVHQPSPDSDRSLPEYEAVLRGKVSGLGDKGSKVLSSDPEYILRADEEGFSARLRAPGHLGHAFGFDVEGASGEGPKVSGYAEWAGKREVAKGLTTSADAKAVARGDGVQLQPIGLGATADLAELLPGVAGAGSSVSMRARYKIGSATPALSAIAKLNSKQLADLRVTASTSLNEDGKATSGLQLSASSNGLDVSYEASNDEKNGLRQAGEVKLPPAAVGAYTARATGRFYQGEEHGTKPRVQLGVEYAGSAKVQGRGLQVGGQSAGYDSGRRLLDSMGKPWKSPELNKAKNSAQSLRKRIESEYGEGRRWLRK